MSDEQNQPVIRDPQAPANMVGRATGEAAGPLATPLAAADATAAMPVTTVPVASSNDPLGITGVSDVEDFSTDRALAAVDPLTRRPRVSSRVLCLVFALLMLGGAAGVWWLAVMTENGQAYDDMVWSFAGQRLPAWLRLDFLTLIGVSSSVFIIAVSGLFALIALVVTLVRRRWWLLGQLAAFAALCVAARFLKGVLPRPFIIHVESQPVNSAPSGHTLLAFAAALALVLAVSRAWRAVAALLAVCWGSLVGLSVVAGRWHRPSDVVMSMLLVGGAAMLVLVFTRTSGMDATGKRASSASVQIVASVMISGGMMAVAYAAYVLWQLLPGMSMSASWAQGPAVASAAIGIVGLAVLLCGLTVALRQLTASPLTKLGLVGAPPAPPRAN